MIDTNKVLIGLGQHISSRTPERCGSCPYFNGDSGYSVTCRDELLDDLYEMLEEQEARVMSVIEVDTWVSTKRIEREPIVIEVRDRYIAWIVSDEYGDLPGANLSREFYGKTYRCWTSRPTKEQINEVAWDE